MKPEIKKYLQDILDSDSVCAIENYMSGFKSIIEYHNDFMVQDAVARRLAIIGEALNKANKMDNDLCISNKPKIIGLRHILVHDYDLVEEETIWAIYKKHLPILKEEVSFLLEV